MAMPITISSRIVGQENNKFFVALNSFGLNDSGCMLEFEHDISHQHPWGVTMLEIRDKGDFSLFGMMIRSFMADSKASTEEERRTEAEARFATIISSELSTLLNSFHGISDISHQPIPIAPSSVKAEFHEEVFSFGAKDSDGKEFELMPMKLKMDELYNKPLVELGFFKSLPRHILSPEAGVSN